MEHKIELYGYYEVKSGMVVKVYNIMDNSINYAVYDKQGKRFDQGTNHSCFISDLKKAIVRRVQPRKKWK